MNTPIGLVEYSDKNISLLNDDIYRLILNKLDDIDWLNFRYSCKYIYHSLRLCIGNPAFIFIFVFQVGREYDRLATSSEEM